MLAGWQVCIAFCMRDMVALRCMAIASNLAFIAYGGLVPTLHLLLLPVNALRLKAWRAPASDRS